MVVVDSREHFSSFADVVVAGPDSNPIAAGVSTSAGLEGEPEADTLVLDIVSEVRMCRYVEFTVPVLHRSIRLSVYLVHRIERVLSNYSCHPLVFLKAYIF